MENLKNIKQNTERREGRGSIYGIEWDTQIKKFGHAIKKDGYNAMQQAEN